MVKLLDLVDESELNQMIKERRITKQVHPNLPISILNYTNRAQYMNQWTKAERVCRGLIVEDATGEVIARGPEKFFNYGQTGAPEISLDTLVLVTKKEDGSLGIGWRYKHNEECHYGIATRGSFTSDQSVRASAKCNDGTTHLRGMIMASEGVDSTSIFEIVYPENRIVLDYGDRDETIRLGAVDNLSGVIHSRYANNFYRSGQEGGMDWLAKTYTLSEALTLPVPDTEEGYVLDVLDADNITTGHVKLKGDRYKQLHALLTNTTGRRIWVQLAARACHSYIQKDADWGSMLGGDPADFKRVDLKDNLLDSLLTNVPDEFYDWVTKQIDSIEDNVSDLMVQAFTLANRLRDVEDSRAQYEVVKDHPLATGILHLARTGSPDRIVLKAWNISQPAGDETPFKTMED